MATKKFSDPWLRGLKLPDGETRAEWHDAAETGLLVTVNSKRRVTFSLYARFPRQDGEYGPPSRKVLGDFAPFDSKDRIFVVKKGVPALSLDDARQKAREWKASIAAGVDPSKPVEQSEPDDAAPAMESSPTIGEVFAEYYKRHALKEGQKDGRGKALAPLRSASEIKRIFDRYVLEDLQGNVRWRDRQIESITRKEVTGLLDIISDTSGATQADAVLAQLSALFNWHAAREDAFLSPIVRGMKRSKPSERKRKRILSDDEIRIFWQAAGIQETFGAYCQCLLLMAQRREKIRVMHRDHLSDDGVWTVETEDREKGNVARIRLSSQAMRIIRRQPTTATRPFVFQGRLAGPINGFTKDKAALDAKMEEIAGHPIPHWVLHDLRRTAKTLMTRAGVLPHVSERVLGHAIEGVEGVYDQHDYFAEKNDALKKLGILVDNILNSTGKVVAIKRGRKAPAAPNGGGLRQAS